MKKKILSEINKEKYRTRLARYTIQAYNLLPKIDNPLILDIGCGSGVPTIELAILSKGKIIAVDSDRAALNILKDKIKVFRLSNNIKTVRCSLLKLRFKHEHFDIVWAEGSITVIGFENGLKDWYRFIKPDGFLVIHDDIKNVQAKKDLISKYNYRLLSYFKISEAVWLAEYFKPLEKHINELRIIYKNDLKAISIIEQEAYEIKLFKQSPGDFASMFYIIQKIPK